MLLCVCRGLNRSSFVVDGDCAWLPMEWWRDSWRDGGDGSRLLGLKSLSDLVFHFLDLRRKLRDGGPWRGETAPPPSIYLPLGRRSGQPEERSLVTMHGRALFPSAGDGLVVVSVAMGRDMIAGGGGIKPECAFGDGTNGHGLNSDF
ncbi:hypothetical protein IGI04_034580 [Brassica rapa subsp. trilocularis]|uniref:Uncharacterized protein n=1 Tax=Brassica rapa subsp. trilocularis TaxID=1813537 RepID=A0ABQ7LC03_BRACM|nr:hypothetical protein IGI04_034580 [Brassica rapa subsp. trilocularis]